MEDKIIKKNSSRKLWIFGGITGALILTAGIAGLTWYFVSANTAKQYNVSEKETFLRQRSMSLRFATPSGSGLSNLYFGTTWIFNKSSTQDFVYYMATNIHVIAPVTQLTGSGTSSTYSISPDVQQVTLGYAQDPAVNKGSNDLFLETISNSNLFPSIVYTGTSYNTYKYWEAPNGTIYNYPYSMSDIAILEFNFSSASQSFKNFLKYYDNSPTKFETNAIDQTFTANNNEYFIGGFPYLENENSNYIGTWKFESSINKQKDLVDGTVDTITPTSTPPTFTNGTQFPANSGRYFKNIARQVIINNLNLMPGSSGSMVINGNNLISGIYWGGYTSHMSNGTETFFGGFDVFVTNSYHTYNTSITNTIYPAYNRLQDIFSVIK